MDNGASSYRRFLDGDETGFVELVRDYKDGLILFLNRYVNNIHIAEDLAEETFFRLITKQARFVVKSSFKTWLYTIGRNIAVNYVKRANKTETVPPEDLETVCSDQAALEEAYFQKEQTLLLHRALSRINPHYSKVLHLKYFDDMTNAQIACVLRKSKRQIENLLYQAKKALREELDKEGFVYEGL